MLNKKLELTSNQVLAAAAKCADAKRVLETMFPDVFKEEEERIKKEKEDSKYFNFSDWASDFKTGITPFHTSARKSGLGATVFEVRDGGNFKEKSFCLSKTVNWKILTDSDGMKVLVPSKKQ